METETPCPICTLTDLLDRGDGQVECATCGHVWELDPDSAGGTTREVRDANGNLLQDGDSVTLIKDLKVKGAASTTIKVGTRVNNIRLIDGDHEIDCKVDGRGVLLKAQFVKKV